MPSTSGVDRNMHSIIYAFFRMIEYHDSKDDTLKHFSFHSTRTLLEKSGGKVCLTKQIIQSIFFRFLKNLKDKHFVYFPLNWV